MLGQRMIFEIGKDLLVALKLYKPPCHCFFALVRNQRIQNTSTSQLRGYTKLSLATAEANTRHCYSQLPLPAVCCAQMPLSKLKRLPFTLLATSSLYSFTPCIHSPHIPRHEAQVKLCCLLLRKPQVKPKNFQ